MSQIDRFLKGEVILNCRTEETAQELEEIMNRTGDDWMVGNWISYGANTCYDYFDDYFCYSRKTHYMANYPNIQIEEFKGVDSMEFTFEEVIARIKTNEVYECTSKIFTIRKVYKNENGNIKFEWIGDNESYGISRMAIFKLKPSRKPVTFSEAVASGKNIRFGRDIDKDGNSGEPILNDCIDAYCEGKYLSLSETMLVLGWMYTADDIKEILDGNWYVEGEN